MKLLTQYHIPVQFCFQGISAWHSVALTLAAVLTWTVLWDVLSSLNTKTSFLYCQCPALVLRDMALLFCSQRPWQLLSPLTSCHSSSLPAGVSCKDQGRREGRGCVVPAGASHRATGLLYKRRWAEGTAGEQICSAHPLSRSGGIQLYRERREPEPFWTVLRRKGKGMESGCSSVCWRVFLFPEFKLMDVAGCICEYIKWLKPETGSQMN